MKPTDLFNDLQQKVSEALRNSPAKDIEKNVRSMMTQGFARLDLVTREEFDVQSQVLARTRARLEELEARIAVLIRRGRKAMGGGVLRVADLVLDPEAMTVHRAGLELHLSPTGFQLLSILMRESPRVVSRQEIEREIWKGESPDSDTLRSHLYNLRKTIDRPFDNPLLHTMQTAGYKVADLSDSQGSRESAPAVSQNRYAAQQPAVVGAH